MKEQEILSSKEEKDKKKSVQSSLGVSASKRGWGARCCSSVQWLARTEGRPLGVVVTQKKSGVPCG